MSFLTGLSSAPLSFAQLNDVGLMCNGIDANKIMDMRLGTAKDLGMAAPGAAPTKSEGAAGNVKGTVKYRVRWKDSSTQTYSLPSASLTVTTASKQITITRPGSPPSRATHWILERTVDANETYFSWLKKQPAGFQDAAIGPVRAKLLRDGGLSADRFAQMRLNKSFKPLTLAEMKKLEPLAFEKAGITLNLATGLPISGR